MQNQRMRKLLHSGALLALFAAECKGSENPFSQRARSSKDPRINETKETDTHGLYSSAVDLPMGSSSSWNGSYFGEVNEIRKKPTPKGQHAAEFTGGSFSMGCSVSSTSRNTSTTGRTGSSALPSISVFMHRSAWSEHTPSEEQRVSGQCEQINQHQYISQPGVHEYTSNAKACSVSSASSNEHMPIDEKSYLNFVTLDKDTSIWTGLESFKTMEDMIKCYSQPGHYAEAASSSKNFFSEPKNSSAKVSAGEKRGVDAMDDSIGTPACQSVAKAKRKKKEVVANEETDSLDLVGENEKTMENKELPVQNSRVFQPETASDSEKGTDLNLSLWNYRRLYNTRRRGYKPENKIQYRQNVTDKFLENEIKNKRQQMKFREEVEDFSRNVAPGIDSNAIWYFVASSCRSINPKYKVLLGLKDLFESADEKYKKMVENLKGYYPGIIDDAIEYIRKHRPMNNGNEKDLSECRERCGDVYIRENLVPNYYNPREDSWIDQIDEKYHTLVHAVRMILVLPEVYEDFSNITSEFIENTEILEDTANDLQNYQILLKIQELVGAQIEERIDSDLYGELYDIFKDVYGEEALQKLAAADLYRDMYTILGKFYENAELFDRRNKYALTGKYIISNQKYIKCAVKAGIRTEEKDGRVLDSEYSFESNKWDISPDVHAHYHVLYVNNTTHQVRELCMPLYEEKSSGKEHYLHTIDEIVDHIEEICKAEIDSGTVYPFKVKKGTRLWSCIDKKEERNKTVKDLEEYEVVFYHIEEDPKTAKFTFAEFRPLWAQKKNRTCIPLFLTPLMRSAVSLGPFDKMSEHTEIDSMHFVNREPDVYTYKSNYIDINYSDLYKYYSNLYILNNTKKKKKVDCYIMGCVPIKRVKNAVEAVWYVRVPSSVDAYTHCVLNKSFMEEENAKKFDDFMAAVESRTYCQDSELQGFWLRNNCTSESASGWKGHTIFNLLANSDCYRIHATKKSQEQNRVKINQTECKLKVIEKVQKEDLDKINKDANVKHKKQLKRPKYIKKQITKKHLKNICRKLYLKQTKRPDPQAELIVFRNVNENRSNLCAHNEILDVFISIYKLKVNR
ncbi:hypothetical protein NEMIN01_2447 [Nematocida minor]|uniref:uncharacterized protein n=1 Tax=Nematocida minor TaxID=1912983 RepID=UPI0022212284|nr:uncharacterized protein NEMIN01_2447 [Nematocida minor]KAI5193285.1 hypothetical protein NEMIN01_2447 [Nematocida minor]